MGSTRELTSHRETRELIQEAEEYGWTVETSRGGHLVFTHPDVPRPQFASKSPSDSHSVANARARLKRELTHALAKKHPERLDRVVEKNPGEVYTCEICTGRGNRRTFLHPLGLINHIEEEHPAPPLPAVEEEVDHHSEYEQEQEIMSNEYEDRLKIAELEKFLRENFTDGQTLTLQDIREAFPEKDVLHAVSGIKRRVSYPRLDRLDRSRSYRYVAIPPDPEEEEEQEHRERAAADVTPSEPSSNGQTHGRLFEEVGTDLSGRPLVRADDGSLWAMELKPL